MFSFQMFVDPTCTYERIYSTCSFTIISLIFILRYNLQAKTNPETFNKVPSNTWGFVTSVLTAVPPPTSPALSAIDLSSNRACI